MKFFKFLFKFIFILLAICGMCYILVDIFNKLNKHDDEDDFLDETEEKSLIKTVKEKAQKEWARIR